MATFGDEVINKHIQTRSCNATYISWSSQNELIQAIGAVRTKKLLLKLMKSSFSRSWQMKQQTALVQSNLEFPCDL